MVDISFDTGAVKITPSHDHNDYECGKRHSLPFIDMMNDNGYITDVAPQFKVSGKYFIHYWFILLSCSSFNKFLSI